VEDDEKEQKYKNLYIAGAMYQDNQSHFKHSLSQLLYIIADFYYNNYFWISTSSMLLSIL